MPLESESSSMFDRALTGLRRSWQSKFSGKNAPERKVELLPSTSFSRETPWWGEKERFNVLDLGSASEGSIGCFSAVARKFHFADLWDTLSSRTKNEEGKWTPPWNEVIPATPEEKFDVVLCWDILNYINPSELPQISENLRRACSHDVRMLAFWWTCPRRPVQPSRFVVNDEGCFISVIEQTETQPWVYHPAIVERAMPDFKISKSTLFRSGLREDVLVPRRPFLVK